MVEEIFDWCYSELFIVSASLSDPLYVNRKNAALQVEWIVRQLVWAGDHEKISALINLLITEFTSSPDPSRQKGGLIGLAGATVGLNSEAAQHLQHIVPPVLISLSDPDSRVRYDGCEAIYNIANVTKKDYIIYLEQSFDALSKLFSRLRPRRAKCCASCGPASQGH